MKYQDAAARLQGYRDEMTSLREKVRATLQAQDHQAVADYEFRTTSGTCHLSELFGAQDTLIVIHNMGAGCSYCTLWADGLNGVVDHLSSRAAFVVTSPDSPADQQRFAAERGWRFNMVSHAGSSFAEDMGYANGERMHPGVSVFRRLTDGVVRVADTEFGPGDDFCSVWHLFDLLPEGVNGWQPRYRYQA